MKRVTLERTGAGVFAASDAPCDPTQGTPELDARTCPMTHSLDITSDTSTLTHRLHNFTARTADLAGNAAVDTWSVRIDRSEPTPAAVVEFSTPTTVASALQWAHENLDRPIVQLGYHRFDHCPHFAVKYCVFSRPDGSETLMNLDPSTIWEHAVPGMDSWTH